jgi:hypothetical protein
MSVGRPFPKALDPAAFLFGLATPKLLALSKAGSADRARRVAERFPANRRASFDRARPLKSTG